jgi:hypothetical protein
MRPGTPQAIKPEPVVSGVGIAEAKGIDVLGITGLADSFRLEPAPISLTDFVPVADFLSAEETSSDPIAQTPRPRGRVIASVGGNAWSQGITGAQPERAAYESTIVSYQSQVSYLQPIKQHWVLSVGVQYQQLESRFDGRYDIEDYEVTLTDVVLERENNLVTNRVKERRGDITLTVPAKRVITHFNATELYQAQVAFGRTWTTARLQTDVLVGGSMNLLTRNQGRTLYQGELRFYQGAATDFLANQGSFNGFISGRVTYRLSEQWGIVSGLHLQQSLRNWSLEPGLRMRPMVMGVEIGLSYRL